MHSPANAFRWTEPDIAERNRWFFNCEFVWSPRDLPGREPYVIVTDERGQAFTETLIRACRGERGFRGVVREVSEIPEDAIVFCEGPVWRRRYPELAGAGICGPRARVLLYFDVDPSGFWDFAQACGSKLGEIFRRGATADNAKAIAPFLEHWTGSRLSRGRLLPYGQFYTRDFYPMHRDNAEKIVRIMAAFADDESRAAYSRILFGTAEQVVTAFTRSVFGAQQYMEIVEPQPGDVIVNCGVGRAWELPYFLCNLKGRGEIHNIDPNIVYFSSHFADFVYHFTDVLRDHPIVVGDHDGKISLGQVDSGMVMSGDEGISGGEGPDAQLYDIRKLDSLMEEGLAERVDYLKMDVEGGEKSVLAGAVETIRRHRPKLAVAIYHQPSHFWDYPAFILDHFEDYRFYLRQYGYSRFETLLYAVPAEAIDDRSGLEGLPRPAPHARRPPEERHDQPVLFYSHDAEDAPRDFYIRPIRTLSRHFGVSWETADIQPGPYVDAAQMCGVIETEQGAVLLTSQETPDGGVEVTTGLGRGGMETKWTHALRLPAGTQCRPVESADGAARFLVHLPDGDQADLYRLSGPSLTLERSLSLDSPPICASWDGERLCALCQVDGGAAEEVCVSAAGDVTRTAVDAPKGRLLGQALVKRFGPDGSRHEAVLAVLDPGARSVSFHRATGRAFEKAASFDWDRRLRLVPTTVARTVVEVPVRGAWRGPLLRAAGRVGMEGAVRRANRLVRRLAKRG